ncbi:MAG: SurA N-terminal domain-containing protein [Syntrophaceae bacterium]|nr:SurA N-terminal domain-containing protein [Syntrophaceae bacterium]
MESHLENADTALCPSCSRKNERRARFCTHCGNSLPRRRKVWTKKRPILFGAIGLILAGVIGYLLTGGIESKLVARVNGEDIIRKEFSQRVDQAKRLYEYRYGRNLFRGDSGKENLSRLKNEMLEELITEKILLQEAKSAGYTSAPEEEIMRHLEMIKKQSGLSEVDFIKRIGPLEDLKEELSRRWIISQFIKKAILKGDQTNGELLFGQWLTNTKAKAKIETYEKLEPVSTGKASCCKSGCGGGRAQSLDPKTEQEAKSKALEYYERKTQKREAEAKVTNFGCHIQVDIIEDGKVVVSLTYNGGEVQEI